MGERDHSVRAPGRGAESAPSLWFLWEVVNHPHVVEVLDALSRKPLTATEIAARAKLGRRLVTAVLRILAARSLVVRDRGGSWDTRAPAATTYRLTDRGRATAELLSSVQVWTSLYERADHSGEP